MEGMKIIRTEIIIHSSAQNIWNILIDFTKYPNWNPFITKIYGKLSIGEKITVTIRPEKIKEVTFKPKIIMCNEYQVLSWKGKFIINGLFDGIHSFEIIPINQQETKFIHVETFSGILIPFMGKLLDKTRTGFETMNLALKKRAENLNTI